MGLYRSAHICINSCTIMYNFDTLHVVLYYCGQRTHLVKSWRMDTIIAPVEADSILLLEENSKITLEQVHTHCHHPSALEYSQVHTYNKTVNTT